MIDTKMTDLIPNDKKADKTIYNDGIKYSKEKQGINESPNIPAGVKKPKMTMK